MPAITYKWRALAVVVLGSITLILDTTVINVALPSITNALSTNLDRAQLIISMYLLGLALIVPSAGDFSVRLGTKGAVLSAEGKSSLYVVRDGTAYLIDAAGGLIDAQNMEILSGVGAGDQVVVSGQHLLRDATPVTIAESTEPPSPPS